MLIAIAVGIAFLSSAGITLLLKPLLRRLGVIDVPNERSSHSSPAIRGLGLAPLLSIVLAFGILLLRTRSGADTAVLLVVLLVSVAAGLLGWFEDHQGVPIAVRAGLQLLIGLGGATAAVAIADASWWLVLIAAVFVAGYINVANFMDGINGISGLHGAVVGCAFAITGALADVSWMVPAGLIIAAAFIGFLPWNLRGGMFLGDVGSYLLGGSLAIIAVAALLSSVPPLAVLGPLSIYLVDSGATLVRRIVRGERWYEPHRTHIYQQLTDAGLSHVQVSLTVGAATVAGALAGSLSAAAPALWALSAAIVILVVSTYLALPAILRSSRGPASPSSKGI